MRHEGSRQLYAYWDELRGSRSAPERSEIEPSDIRAVLGDTFILEASMKMRTIAYRLAGTRLCAAHGCELKGLGYLVAWSEMDNFEVAKAVRQVYGEHTPMLLGYTAQTDNGRFVEYESILLPLQQAADGNQRILGIATPRSMPYWLGAEPVTQLHLRTLRPIAPQAEAASLAPEPLSEEEPSLAGEGRRRVGHLTVVDGGLD